MLGREEKGTEKERLMMEGRKKSVPEHPPSSARRGEQGASLQLRDKPGAPYHSLNLFLPGWYHYSSELQACLYSTTGVHPQPRAACLLTDGFGVWVQRSHCQ